MFGSQKAMDKYKKIKEKNNPNKKEFPKKQTL